MSKKPLLPTNLRVKVEVAKDWKYECDGPGKGPSVTAGEILDVRSDFAGKLIRRGVAGPYTGRKKGRKFPPTDDETPALELDQAVTEGGAVTLEGGGDQNDDDNQSGDNAEGGAHDNDLDSGGDNSGDDGSEKADDTSEAKG